MADKEKTDYKMQIKTFLSDWAKVAKKKWWIYLIEFAVIAIILIADLLSKKYVTEFLQTQPGWLKDNVIPGLIDLEYDTNTGAGFGIFQGNTAALIVVTCIVLVCIAVYLFFNLKESEWLRISLVFIVGGGIGNLVDRIALGYVRDFIKFAFWKNFAIFNVADSFVTVGAFMLVVVLIVMLVQEGKKNQKEFEEEQKNKAINEQEQIDPLDAPINLNPMMKSENDYSFVVSEKKDENREQNSAENNAETAEENTQKDVKNTEEITQNSAENTQESTDNLNNNSQSDRLNQGENTAENTDDEKREE